MPTYREVLSSSPEFWKFGGFESTPLGQARSGKLGNEIRSVLLDHNYEFAPSNYEHPQFYEQAVAANSALYDFLYVPLQKGTPQQKADASVLRQWIKQNIFLNRETKKEIDSW